MNLAVSPHLRSLEALQAQISAQTEISCLLREQLHDLRINRDAWRTQAEAAQHILVDGRPRRQAFSSVRRVCPDSCCRLRERVECDAGTGQCQAA